MPVRNHRRLETTTLMGTTLKRKPFLVDERMLCQTKKVPRVNTAAETIRLAVERIVAMEEFWKFMEEGRHTLKPGSAVLLSGLRWGYARVSLNAW
jgi:hypothetical protein